MSNIMGYFRKSKNALEKGGITLKNTTEEKVRCPICKSYETRRWNFPGIRIPWIAAEPSAARRRALSVG